MSIAAGPLSLEVPVTPDLPGRIRRAIAQQNREELSYLNPIIRALAYNEVTVGEIKALDADQALWLLSERARQHASHG
ncbi:MAG: hypothetical protein ACTHJ6_05605 [Oryzihumus sp.]|jgi:hypothetical protein